MPAVRLDLLLDMGGVWGRVWPPSVSNSAGDARF